jgi:hypothetical protein
MSAAVARRWTEVEIDVCSRRLQCDAGALTFAQTKSSRGLTRFQFAFVRFWVFRLRWLFVDLKTGELDFQPQVVGTVGVDEGLFQTDLSIFIETEKRLIEGLATFLNALLHRFLEDIDLAFFYKVPNAWRVQ